MGASTFPYTPFSGLNAANSSITSNDPKSPACQISSHASKWWNTALSKKECVSDNSPIFIKKLKNKVTKFSYNPQNALLYLDKDRKSTRLNSSHVKISYAVFCLKKKTKT